MHFRQICVTAFALILWICLLSTISEGRKLFGKSKPKSSPYGHYPAPYRPKSRGISKGKLAAGALVGAGVGLGAAALAVHAMKKNNPCAFSNAGMTNSGQMDSKIAANERCQGAFAKYQNELTKCPNATSAECTELGGDMKCAVFLDGGGPAVPIFDCA